MIKRFDGSEYSCIGKVVEKKDKWWGNDEHYCCVYPLKLIRWQKTNSWTTTTIRKEVEERLKTDKQPFLFSKEMWKISEPSKKDLNECQKAWEVINQKIIEEQI